MRHVISFDDYVVPSVIESHSSDSENGYVMLFEDFNSTMTIIKNAISNRFVCTICYKGERKGVVDDGYRYIEPYALGVNKQGNNVLRAWLLKGKSRRGRIDPSQVPGWRLFRIDRITSISTSLQTYTKARPKYNPEDSGMTEVMYSAQF